MIGRLSRIRGAVRLDSLGQMLPSRTPSDLQPVTDLVNLMRRRELLTPQQVRRLRAQNEITVLL
jgi:hypothetical protein